MIFGINITTFNRPEYVKTFFDSLKNTHILEGTIINITDDASTDSKTQELIKSFIESNEKIKVNFFKNEINLGSKINYEKSLCTFINENVDFIINLDSDCVFHNDWMLEIKKIISLFGENLLCSSFFCEMHLGNPKNGLHIIKNEISGDVYVERDTLNGLGICFPKKILNEFLNKQITKHFDSYLTDDLKKKYGLRCICTSVSYIQHIGEYGVNSRPNFYDKSNKFIG
jgi:glycosyltransferase involved in cell wall biosynthesis